MPAYTPCFVVLLLLAAALPAADTGFATPNYRLEAIAVDGDGNRYLAGSFSSASAGRDFDPGPGSDLHSGAGNTDVAVTRIDADGSYGWTATFGGSSNEFATGICVAGDTVYVCGYSRSDHVQIDQSGPSQSNIGEEDGFVLALARADGGAVSGFGTGGMQRVAGSAADQCQAIAADGTRVVVIGEFLSTDLGIGAAAGDGPLAIINDPDDDDLNDRDVFIASLDPGTGAGLSAFDGDGLLLAASHGNDYGIGVALADGVAYLGGTTWASDFGIGANAGDGDLGADGTGYCAAIDAASGAALSTFAGGVQRVALGVQALAVNSSRVYTVSTCSTAARIGDGPSLGNRGDSDGVVCALARSDGSAAAFGTHGMITFGGGDWDHADGIAVSDDLVAVAGSFASASLDIAGAAISPEPAFSNAGGLDGLILVLDAATGAGEELYGFNGAYAVQSDKKNTVQAIALAGATVHASGYGTGTVNQADVITGLGSTWALSLPPSPPNFAPSIDALTVDGQPIDLSSDIRWARDKAVGVPITFHVEASDRDGDALSYHWDFADTYTATGADVTHTYLARDTGSWTVRVSVDDGTTTVATTVDVKIPFTGNYTPWVAVSFEPETVATGQTLYASAIAGDNNGDPLSVWWEFDGVRTDGLQASHVYQTPGAKTVYVYVSDGSETLREAHTVTVTGSGPQRQLTFVLADGAGAALADYLVERVALGDEGDDASVATDASGSASLPAADRGLDQTVAFAPPPDGAG